MSSYAESREVAKRCYEKNWPEKQADVLFLPFHRTEMNRLEYRYWLADHIGIGDVAESKFVTEVAIAYRMMTNGSMDDFDNQAPRFYMYLKAVLESWSDVGEDEFDQTIKKLIEETVKVKPYRG